MVQLCAIVVDWLSVLPAVPWQTRTGTYSRNTEESCDHVLTYETF